MSKFAIGKSLYYHVFGITGMRWDSMHSMKYCAYASRYN